MHTHVNSYLCILTSNSIEDKPGVIVTSMLLQFQLVDKSEAILVQEPLDRLNDIQLCLHGRKKNKILSNTCVINFC